MCKRQFFAILTLLTLASISTQAQHVISTIAGGGPNNASAVLAPVYNPTGVASDTNGNLYIAANYAYRVYKVSPTGLLTVFAGNGNRGSGGDEGPAVDAEIVDPIAVAADAAGNVFIADGVGNCIREVTHDGKIHTVAGTGMWGFSGDLGPATAAHLYYPSGVAVDKNGNVFVTDTHNNRIREFTVGGNITTVAGNGAAEYSGEGLLAIDAGLNAPQGLTVDGNGNIFFADSNNFRIRKFTVGGNITTVAGNGARGNSGDGGPAIAASINYSWGVAVDGSGNIFIADTHNSRVRKFTVDGNITTVAGNGSWGSSGDKGPATAAQLNIPFGVAVDGSGHVFVADVNNNRIRSFTVNGNIDSVAGNGSSTFGGDNGPAIDAALGTSDSPRVAVDIFGNYFLADTNNHAIRKLDPRTGLITTVAGTGSAGYSGDGGAATEATLNGPQGLAFDLEGNFFFADSWNNVVRRIDTVSGVVTTIAGTGSYGYSGDGGPAISAELKGPQGIAFDSIGNLFISDVNNCVIRKVDAVTSAITTVAGDASLECSGSTNFSGDGGSATAATLSWPRGVTFDADRNMLIADTNNHAIRKVDAITGIIMTVAGDGNEGYIGDGDFATSARLSRPNDVLVDGAGSLFIADTGNQVVRKVADGIISTVAGTGWQGFAGDGGEATQARLNSPSGVAGDSAGNLLIYDAGNARVRNVTNLITPGKGNAANPGISLSPNPVSFGGQLVGQQSQQMLTISNTGTARLVIAPLSSWSIPANSGEFYFSWSSGGGSCELGQQVTLDPGQSCQLGLRFAPDSVGAKSLTFVVKDNAPGTHSVTLTGFGTLSTGPAISIAPPSLDFGSMTLSDTSSPQTVTITNVGGSTWTPNTIGLGAGTIDDFTMVGGSCIQSGSVLVPGTSCTVDVAFSPWLAGSRSGAISITDNSSNSPYSVVLSGAGVLPNGVLAALPAGLSPMRVGVNTTTNKMYVANAGSSFITVIDGASNTTSTVDVVSPANRVAVNSVTNRIYVNSSDNHVTVIDGSDNSTTRLDVGGRPTDVVVDSVRNKIYVPVDTNDAATSYVAVIDGDSNSMTNILLGGMPLYAAVNPVSNKIYVTMYGRWITVIDGATGATSSVQPQDQPFWVVVNPVTDKIYVGSWNGGTSVTVINGPDNTTSVIQAGNEPEAPAINTASNKIYVASSLDNTVTVIDGKDNSTQTVTVGARPFYVAVSETTNKIYIANSEDNTVSVLDGSTNNIINSLPAYRPWPIVINPLTNRIYVGNRRAPSGGMSGNMFVIDGGSFAQTLTIRANSQSMTYGGALPGLTFAVEPNVSLDTQPTCVSATSSNTPVGIYPAAITCTGASKAGYSISYVNGRMEVLKATLTVTASDKARKYGEANPLLDGTMVGLVAGDGITATYWTPATPGSSVGTYLIEPSSFLDPNNKLSNYSWTTVNGTLTINKATLTVTANDKQRTYGAANPLLDGTMVGLVAGDGITATYWTPATPGSSVGTYLIEPSSFLDPNNKLGNYSWTTVNGTLTINKASLTITANNWSKIYGAVSTFAGVEFTKSGLLNGDAVNSVSLISFGSPATATVGSYSIVPSNPVGTGLGNYSFTFINGTLTVGIADLTLTANNRTKTYGTAATFQGTEFTAAGLLNGDTITGVAFNCAGSAATATVGSYSIVPAGAVGPRLGNYGITYVNGNLTVDKATLTVRANDKQRIYGAANPSLDGTLSGLLSGDNITATYWTPATVGSPVGTYLIEPSSLLDPSGKLGNYTVANINGTLTVTKATLMVTANDKSMPYGGPIPTLTASTSGYANGDTSAVLSGNPSLATTANLSSRAGNYPITVTQGTLQAANYNFTFSSGTLTVLPTPPVIAVSFGAPSIYLNGTTSITFTITNPAANTAPLTGLAFTDNLPSGMMVATPVNLTHSCGGTYVAVAGSTSASLTSGSVQANSSCQVSLNVTGLTSGMKSNSVTINSTEGGTGNTATASLTVTAYRGLPDYILKADPSSITIHRGKSATVTITLTSLNGYDGTVDFNCSSQAAAMHISCAFTPLKLVGNPDGSPVTTTLVITTAGPLVAVNRTNTGTPTNPGGLLLAFWSLGACGIGVVLMGGVETHRRTKASRRYLKLLIGCGLLLLFVLAGCGGMPQSSNSWTPTGAADTMVTTTATASSNGMDAANPNQQLQIQITVLP